MISSNTVSQVASVCRLDTWETEQENWTETVKVLQHQKHIFETLVNANDLIDAPQKKRKFNADHSLGKSNTDLSLGEFNMDVSLGITHTDRTFSL